MANQGLTSRKGDEAKPLKESEKRIINLFPKYMDKSGSKIHSKFFFGNDKPDRVFKEYQRLTIKKESAQNISILDDSQVSHKTLGQNGRNAQFINDINKTIFDIKLSDLDMP